MRFIFYFQNLERSLSCLDTWQPGSVFKKLDIQQSVRILTKSNSILLRIADLCLELSSDFKYYLHVNARQTGKVLNGLNERQSEVFTEFPLKDSFKLFDGL